MYQKQQVIITQKINKIKWSQWKFNENNEWIIFRFITLMRQFCAKRRGKKSFRFWLTVNHLAHSVWLDSIDSEDGGEHNSVYSVIRPTHSRLLSRKIHSTQTTQRNLQFNTICINLISPSLSLLCVCVCLLWFFLAPKALCCICNCLMNCLWLNARWDLLFGFVWISNMFRFAQIICGSKFLCVFNLFYHGLHGLTGEFKFGVSIFFLSPSTKVSSWNFQLNIG